MVEKNNRRDKSKPLTLIRVQDVLDRVSTKDGLAFYGVHFNNKGFASCPFHNERTPSFHYNKKEDTYYCFSCHKGGTIINFVADYFNFTLPNDLRLVLEKIDHDFNLGLGKPMSKEEQQRYKEDQRLNKILQQAEANMKQELSSLYDKWSRIHQFLYRAYLEIDKQDVELAELIDYLDDALNEFSGNELRAWPLPVLTPYQLDYISDAEKYLQAKEQSFEEFVQNNSVQDNQPHFAVDCELKR